MAVKLSDDDVEFLRKFVDSDQVAKRKALQAILIDQLAVATGRQEDVLRAATTLRAAGDAEASERRYDQLIASADCNHATLIQAAVLKLHLGRLQQAYEAFVRANAQQATPDGTILAAVTLKRLGRLEEALTELQKAEVQGGRASTILAEKGEVYERKLDYGSAAQQYARYIEAANSNLEKANGYLRLGICYDRLGQMDDLKRLILSENFKTIATCNFGAVARTISWSLRLNIPVSYEWVRDGLEQGKAGSREEAIDAALLLIANPDAGDISALAKFFSSLPAGTYGRDGINFLAKYSFRDLVSRMTASQRFVSVEKAIASLVSALYEKRPYSLIRLGDGEGNFVGPFMDSNNSFLTRQQSLIYGNWFGYQPAVKDAKMLYDKVFAIMPEVDILGVPDENRLSLELKHVPRGYFGVYMAAAFALQTAKENIFVTPGIHRLLFKSDELLKCLHAQEKVHTISCHKEFGQKIRQYLDVTEGQDFVVPGEMGAGALPAEARQGRHFPDVFQTVLQWLKSLPEGGTILVAAGICGKVYVGHAKRQGLGAIDIGAMADFVMGFKTRDYFKPGAFVK